MQSIQKDIAQWYSHAADDDSFVAKLNGVIEKKGAATCQEVLFFLAGLKLDAVASQKCWEATLLHRDAMKAELQRDVSLMTALCDYLGSQAKLLENPKLVTVAAYDQVVRESTHDGLTGLFNRAYFTEAMNQQLFLADRHDQDLSVLFLDIDDFKEINDSYGHANGDVVLQRVAEIIRAEARTSDVVARYGGEEFVVLMPQTDYISALVLAERIRTKIEAEVIPLSEGSSEVTISGGIASYPIHAKTSADLLNLADSALYRAKGAGKNNISLFKEDKRRFVRTKLNSSVKIKEMGFHSSPTLRGVSKDICIGGILFENEEALAIGSMIQVSILIGKEHPILLIGTVVRVEAYGPHSYDIGMALSFKEMEKNAKDEISKFLLSQSAQLEKVAS